MNIVMGTWYIFEKDDLSFLLLVLGDGQSREIPLRNQDCIFIQNFLSPKSQHVYCTTYGQGYITLYPNNQCTVEVL
jgi:hypothetical protein